MLRDEKRTDIAIVDWNERKENAACLIRLCVSDDTMNDILDLTTPKDVWKKSKNQYVSKTLRNKLFVKQHLYSLKLQEGCDCRLMSTLSTTSLLI